VIIVLGLLLTIFGGRVDLPEFRKNTAGETERVMVEKNKFLNARNLAQLAKDTSFIAIMAVGATFVIISGGIDLSVGAIYALASVLGAMVFHRFGPEVAGDAVAGWGQISLGTMAIDRGIAFVTTKGQSIGGFPAPFRDLIRWETGGGLSLIPLAVMI